MMIKLKSLALSSILGLTLLATPYVVSKLGLHDFGIWAILRIS